MIHPLHLDWAGHLAQLPALKHDDREIATLKMLQAIFAHLAYLGNPTEARREMILDHLMPWQGADRRTVVWLRAAIEMLLQHTQSTSVLKQASHNGRQAANPLHDVGSSENPGRVGTNPEPVDEEGEAPRPGVRQKSKKPKDTSNDAVGSDSPRSAEG